MGFAGYINNLYKKYKKPLAIFILIFFVYKVFNYYYGNIYEGLTQPVCSTYTNCADCVKNYSEGNDNSPCYWSPNLKKCSSSPGMGNIRTCPESTPTNSNCPKCDECPKLTLLKTPTFITQQ